LGTAAGVPRDEVFKERVGVGDWLRRVTGAGRGQSAAISGIPVGGLWISIREIEPDSCVLETFRIFLRRAYVLFASHKRGQVVSGNHLQREGVDDKDAVKEAVRHGGAEHWKRSIGIESLCGRTTNIGVFRRIRYAQSGAVYSNSIVIVQGTSCMLPLAPAPTVVAPLGRCALVNRVRNFAPSSTRSDCQTPDRSQPSSTS